MVQASRCKVRHAQGNSNIESDDWRGFDHFSAVEPLVRSHFEKRLCTKSLRQNDLSPKRRPNPQSESAEIQKSKARDTRLT